MKIVQPITLLLLISLIFSSCEIFKNCEEASGAMTEKQIDLASVSSVEVSSNVTLYLSQGSPQSATIRASQNIIDLLKTDVKNNEWDISFERCVKANKPIEIYLTVPSIKKIDIEGAGNVISETVIKSDELRLEIDGSGNIELEIDSKELQSEIAGSGDIKLSGNTKLHDIEINGSGDVNAYELKSDETTVEINGSGDVKVNVSYSLDVEVNGSGDVYYRGDVKEIKSDINGSGKLNQED